MEKIILPAILLLKDMGIRDVIDILIVSVIIYGVIRYTQKNRIASLAKGIVIFIGIYLFFYFTHLYTVTWLLNQILNVGLVAIIVIFQPEIRRALEYIGSGKFSKRDILSKAGEDDFLKSIIKALDNLSQNKVGALIVFERDFALEEIINAKDSVLIDAIFSEKLIETIFYYGTPLHDGAVIIRGDHILAAKCTLPLTKNAVQTKDLGTRHKAGLGMSENSDAFVVIVSEESGMISTAFNGELNRWKKSSEIEAMLKKYCLRPKKQAKMNNVLSNITNLWRNSDGRK